MQTFDPYFVHEGPNVGVLVVCRSHIVASNLKPEEAAAIAKALNAEHQQRKSA